MNEFFYTNARSRYAGLLVEKDKINNTGTLAHSLGHFLKVCTDALETSQVFTFVPKSILFENCRSLVKLQLYFLQRCLGLHWNVFNACILTQFSYRFLHRFHSLTSGLKPFTSLSHLPGQVTKFLMIFSMSNNFESFLSTLTLIFPLTKICVSFLQY